MTFDKMALIVMFGLTFDLLLDTPRKTKMTMIPTQPTHFFNVHPDLWGNGIQFI